MWLPAEQDVVIDTLSVDFAFFGEHDQTAKHVLIFPRPEVQMDRSACCPGQQGPQRVGCKVRCKHCFDTRDCESYRCWTRIKKSLLN